MVEAPRIVLLGALLLGAAATEPAPVELAPLESFADLAGRMKASRVKYTIGSAEPFDAERCATPFWPEGEPVALPFLRTDADGRRSIRMYPVELSALESLKAAEPLYDEGKYEEARVLYQKVVQEHPDFYLAHSHVGDTFYKAGAPEKALPHYEAALELNPYDHNVWAFRGNTLFRLGRTEEALDSYLRSLTLFPRYTALIAGLEAKAEALGVAVERPGLISRGCVEQNEEGVQVTFDLDHPSSPAWLAYSSCKAFWLAEPGYRDARTDPAELAFQTNFGFSPTEEYECLRLLALGYANVKEELPELSDPPLDRLLDAALDGMLLEYAICEVGTRSAPHFTAVLTEQSRAAIRNYIESHLVVRVAGEEAAPTP